MSLPPVRVGVQLRTVDGDTPAFATRSFELTEGIDQPFCATVTLVSEDLDLAVGGLVRAQALVEIERDGFTARTLSAVVTSAGFVAARNGQLVLRVVLEPTLALLRYSTRRRIFADRTLPQVLEAVTAEVFGAFGGAWDVSRLSTAQAPRDYQVQYDETDLDFVLRLLAEAGLCLLHGHIEGEAQTYYVLTDCNAALPGVGLDPVVPAESTPWVLPFRTDGEEEAEEPGVQALTRADRVQPGGVTVRARDWKDIQPTVLMSRRQHDAVGELHLAHPRRLDEGKGSAGPNLDDTAAWAVRAFDDATCRRVSATGSSVVADLGAGSTFELHGHPYADLDLQWAVTRVVHWADFPEVEVEASTEARPTYLNRFEVLPLDAGPVRPPARPRPRVGGMESAVVVGPDGEEIHTDALGRVQVRFAWDDTSSHSCWLRVLSPWAGPGYGASFVPRVGMEVVVSFLGGDPDRPVVAGCLYTGGNQPPGALPDTKTCTTLRSQSSPGGEGFNELRFEDAAGSEELYMHAQRNHRTVVRAAQSTRVGGTRSLTVGRDSTRTIGGSETVNVGEPGGDTPGNLQVLVTGGEYREVGKVHSLQCTSAFWTADEGIVGNAPAMVRWSCATAARDASGRATMALDRPPTDGSVLEMKPTSITLEAPERIELKVGSTVLRLTPQGIAMEGPVITATVERRLWLTADAGSLSLDGKRAELFGGKGSESALRLQAAGVTCKAQGDVEHVGGAVTLRGTARAIVDSPYTHVRGSDNALFEGATVLVKGDLVGVNGSGLVDVKGKPIHLNC